MKIDYDNLRAETEDRIVDLQELQRLVDQCDYHIQQLHVVGHYIENLEIAFGNLDAEGQRALPEPMRTALRGLKHTAENYSKMLRQMNPSPMSSQQLGLCVIAELNEQPKEEE